MAAPTLVQVMDAIEVKLSALGLTVNETISDINLPGAYIELPPIPEYYLSFKHGLFEFDVTVIVLVAKLIDRVGLRQLAGFADIGGAKSIHAAIAADPKLNNTVDDCFVRNFQPLGEDEAARYGFLGGSFTLGVTAQGV